MERFHLYRPPGAGGAFMAAADDGPWVRLADAQAAFDAANQRATETERRLALAVAELAKWREGHEYFDTCGVDEVSTDCIQCGKPMKIRAEYEVTYYTRKGKTE